MRKSTIIAMRYGLLALVLLALVPNRARAAEYFVNKQGADTNAGLDRAAAFLTVQRGVERLEPGDTLTIGPGEYAEHVRRGGLGSSNRDTVIRAEIPGTVVLRGDVPAPAFRPVPGHPFVYEANLAMTNEVVVVNELDTLRILERKPNVAELDYAPGVFHQDRAAGKLYVSTSDWEPAASHRYSISIIPTHGIYLSHPRRVTLEGLAATGFNATRELHYREGTAGGVWGLFLFNGKQCVIRDCRAWLNGWGIGLTSAESGSGDNVIEHCTAWANTSPYWTGDMGGLTIFSGRRDTIRDSTAFLNGMYGINIYGTGTDGGTYGDKNVSGNEAENRSRLVDNMAWGNWCDFKIKTGVDYFHSVEGCVGPGLWSVRGSNITRSLVGRSAQVMGRDNIVLSQETNLDVYAEFVDPDHHDYRLLATSRFLGTGPNGSDRGPYPFAAASSAEREAATRVQRRFLSSLPALRLVSKPVVHSVSATTVNVEWMTSLPAVCELAWGETPDCENSRTANVEYFATYSLAGLKPGRTYYFRIKSLQTTENLTEVAAQHVDLPDVVISFTTLRANAKPVTYTVAPDGKDTNTGVGRSNAWQTIDHAAATVNVGDTVLIAGGTYRERVRIRATGESNAPITFACVPGEKVILSGAGKALANAFIVAGKSHVRFDGLYFVDFNFDPSSGWSPRLAGDFNLHDCRDIRITRCFSDGRGGYTARAITAWQVDGLQIENCVNLNKMSGALHIQRCPNLRMEHTVFVEPMINSFTLNNTAEQLAIMENNIFTDMFQKKAKLNATFAELEDVASLKLKNNCFLLRCFPPEERIVFADVDHSIHKVTQNFTLPAFDKQVADTHTLFADPGFAGDPGVRGNPNDKTGFSPDRLTDSALEIDFDTFFATNPEVVRRSIGLQPEAFKDFVFKRKQPATK